MKDVLALLTSRLATAQPLRYSDILDLDQRTRDFSKTLHPDLQPPIDPTKDWPNETPAQAMQRFTTIFFKEIGEGVPHENSFTN